MLMVLLDIFHSIVVSKGGLPGHRLNNLTFPIIHNLGHFGHPFHILPVLVADYLLLVGHILECAVGCS